MKRRRNRIVLVWAGAALLAGSALGQKAREPRDRSLYLYADEAVHLVGGAEAPLVVDVRDENDYRDAHLPAATHRPLPSVRASLLPVDRSLLIVDEGWGAAATERVCRRLRDQGVAAFILWGGVGAWQARGGALDGPNRSAGRRGTLSPQAFLSQQLFDDWQVVDLSDTTPSVEKLRARLPAPEAPIRVLLLDRDGRADPLLRAAAHEAGFDSVFTVAGGKEALEKEIEFTSQMRQSTRRTVTTTGQGSLTLVVEGGCATCP